MLTPQLYTTKTAINHSIPIACRVFLNVPLHTLSALHRLALSHMLLCDVSVLILLMIQIMPPVLQHVVDVCSLSFNSPQTARRGTCEHTHT